MLQINANFQTLGKSLTRSRDFFKNKYFYQQYNLVNNKYIHQGNSSIFVFSSLFES